MPAGRPSEYSGEILTKTREYIESRVDQFEQVVSQESESYTMYKERLKVQMPTIEGLAVYLKVHRDTIYQWEKDHPEFSDILEELRATQADRLLNNGLSGNYNPTIAKVLLTKHGYTDKQEIDQKTEHSGGITIKFEEPDLQHPEDKGSNGELPSL